MVWCMVYLVIFIQFFIYVVADRGTRDAPAILRILSDIFKNKIRIRKVMFIGNFDIL